MKARILEPPALWLVVVWVVVLSAMSAAGQDESFLAVSEMALARGYDYIQKTPIDTATVFAAEVGKVYCYTRVTGSGGEGRISHIWYHEGRKMADVPLVIRSSNFRTVSSKNILPAWTGRWEVKILDENGAVLATASFQIL